MSKLCKFGFDDLSSKTKCCNPGKFGMLDDPDQTPLFCDLHEKEAAKKYGVELVNLTNNSKCICCGIIAVFNIKRFRGDKRKGIFCKKHVDAYEEKYPHFKGKFKNTVDPMCCVCDEVQPSYNELGEPPKFCHKCSIKYCKEHPGVVHYNIKHKNINCEDCKKEGGATIPSFGYERGKALYCKKHSVNYPGIFYVLKDKCIGILCQGKSTGKIPSFRTDGKNGQPTHCDECIKAEGLNKNDVVHKACEDCGITQASFGLDGDIIRYCGPCGYKHEAIDLKNKRCIKCKIDYAYYNFPGEKAEFCTNCKTDNMVYIRARICCFHDPIDGPCKRWGQFGDENNRSVLYCATCRDKINPKMKNLVDNMCKKCGNKRPSFAAKEGEVARYCKECAFEIDKNMVNVKDAKCSCGTLATFGKELGRPTHCSKCMPPNQGYFDVRHKSCEECKNNRAEYGPLFSSKIHCLECRNAKFPGEIRNPKPRCSFKNCENLATYGIKGFEIPDRCYLPMHAEDRISFEEIKCFQCGALDFMQKNMNLCHKCIIPLLEERKKERKKVKEMAIEELLRKNNVKWDLRDREWNGTSYRPDFAFYRGNTVIFLEVDEDEHKNRKCFPEQKRMYDICNIKSGKRAILIRYNPDKFTTEKRLYYPEDEIRHQVLLKLLNELLNLTEEPKDKIGIYYMFYSGHKMTDNIWVPEYFKFPEFVE